MSKKFHIKEVTTVVLICYQVILVCCDKCLFTKDDREYKYCAEGCCEDEDEEQHCCEQNKDDGISTATAVGLIVGTLIGFCIFFGLLIVFVKSFCFKSKRTQEQVRRQCISLPPATLVEQNSTQQFAIYTIPSTDEEKPPPYIPNEPSAPPSYEEVMSQESQFNERTVRG